MPSVEKDAHVHTCASSGYPLHEPSRYCLCVCGKRFDATVIPPEVQHKRGCDVWAGLSCNCPGTTSDG